MAVLPGLVDLHVHLREPGFEYKETILTGARAARRGGFTVVCPMANTDPVIDSAEAVLRVKRLAQQAREQVPGVNIMPVGALSMGLLGKEHADYAAMQKAGIWALSDDGKTAADTDFMREAAIRAKALGLIITDHAEPETEIVARDILLARETGCRFHLQHISRKESLALIRSAKAEGLNITAETAPHYFALTSAALTVHGGNAKMNPPLAEEADRLAVIEALKDGTIDAIATDHAPHAIWEKGFAPKPVTGADGAAGATDTDGATGETSGVVQNGVIGLETAFAVSYTLLVRGGHMSLERLLELMSHNPAKILGLKSTGQISVDLEQPYIIRAVEFESKGRNTPFEGMEVWGRVLGGQCINR